jgi:hypothetical protein
MYRKSFFLISLALVLALVSSASAVSWTNADAGDMLWSNGNNWEGGVVPNGASVYMSSAVGDCILDYAAPNITTMMGPGGGTLPGVQTLYIDGGSLTSSSYLSIGHGGAQPATDGTGIVTMSNGASIYAGSDLHIGAHGDGTLNVGGNSTAYSPGNLKLAYGVSRRARVNLGLGTINVEELFTVAGKDVLIDITEGTLIVRNQPTDPGNSIDDWIDNYITAYGGAGTVVHTVDGNGYDVLTAIPDPNIARNPSPADEASVAGDVVLSWLPGDYAVSHDVYLGTDFNDVSNAVRLNGDINGNGWVDLADVLVLTEQWLLAPVDSGPSADLNDDGNTDFADFAIVADNWKDSGDGIFRGHHTLDANSYDPCGLDLGRTYYWRIDEVNNAHGDSPWKGEVWSFTTEGCLYDFISNAPSANWQSRGGVVTFGDEFTNEKGCAKLASGELEDGSYVTDYLYTQPDCNSGFTEHWMRGTYSNISIPEEAALVKFTAKVGFETATISSDGVTFSLFIQRSDGCYELCAVDAEYDGVITNLSADLRAYKGQTITVILSANAGDTCEDDLAVWKEAKIVTYGTYEPEVVYDFAANADKASWRTGAGSIDFNDLNNPENGFAQISDGNLEDGNYYTDYLFTRPNYGGASEHFIEGTFDNVIIPKNVTNIKFTATVGLADGAQSSDGVIFLVYVSLRDKITELCYESEVYDGNLATITANLSACRFRSM